MGRKAIPSETQKTVLLKSRRRCCLCFWLEGRDEVQKGNIAHLDGRSENAEQNNLVFLCFDHHDDLDGTTRLAKGLREDEVRHWRDELYKEMEYRFHTVKTRSCELSIVGFLWEGPDDEFKGRFRLKNDGQAAAKSPTVTIRLPDRVDGTIPIKHQQCDGGMGVSYSVPILDPWAMWESRQDIFEPNGRVGIQELGGMNPVLMPGHSSTFEGLLFHLRDYPLGAEIKLEYGVDAEDMPPVRRSLVAIVPAAAEKFLAADE